MIHKRKVPPETGPKTRITAQRLMEDINARKKLSPGVCCRALQFVLEYNKDDVLGIQFDTLFNFTNGTTRTTLLYIYRCRGTSRSFMELNFCPFCGKRRKVVDASLRKTRKKAKKK